jgi:hypothetical protein
LKNRCNQPQPAGNAAQTHLLKQPLPPNPRVVVEKSGVHGNN